MLYTIHIKGYIGDIEYDRLVEIRAKTPNEAILDIIENNVEVEFHYIKVTDWNPETEED